MTTKWEDEGDYYNYTHIVDGIYTEPIQDKNMMIRHCFLEFLSELHILEYNRGYDGIYYDIRIMKRGK